MCHCSVWDYKFCVHALSLFHFEVREQTAVWDMIFKTQNVLSQKAVLSDSSSVSLISMLKIFRGVSRVTTDNYGNSVCCSDTIGIFYDLQIIWIANMLSYCQMSFEKRFCIVYLWNWYCNYFGVNRNAIK